jgi:hypothetical protein
MKAKVIFEVDVINPDFDKEIVIGHLDKWAYYQTENWNTTSNSYRIKGFRIEFEQEESE